MENNYNLVKIVKEYYKEHNLDLTKDSVDDCIQVINDNPELKEKLIKCLENGISSSQLSKLNHILTCTLVNLVMDSCGIDAINDEIITDCEEENSIDEEYVDYSDNEKLDAVSLYLRDLAYYTVPTKEEEVELFKRMANGDTEAKNEIISRNQRLVISIAKKYINREYDFLSAVDDGNLGLITARDKFDVNKGFKFSTYASWWIDQSIRRSKINDTRMMRIPIHMAEKISSINRFRESRLQLTGDYPTVKEIASEFKMDEKKVLDYLKANTEPASLNSPVSNGDGETDTEFGDFIADENSASVVDYAEFNALRKDINVALNNLSLKEKYVIIYRMGIYHTEKLTLSQITQLFSTLKSDSVLENEVITTEEKKEKRIKDIFDRACSKMETKKDLIDKVSVSIYSNNKEKNDNEYLFMLGRIAKNVLEPQEYLIYASYMGIPVNAPYTLEEVGKMFNVTRERIRQIEAKSLRKLRHPKYSNSLKEYLDTGKSYINVRSF